MLFQCAPSHSTGNVGTFLVTCQQSFLAVAFCQLRYAKCSLSSLLSLSAAQTPQPLHPLPLLLLHLLLLSLPSPLSFSFSSTSSPPFGISFHAILSPTVLVTLCWSLSTLHVSPLLSPSTVPETLTVLSPPNFSSSHFNLFLPLSLSSPLFLDSLCYFCMLNTFICCSCALLFPHSLSTCVSYLSFCPTMLPSSAPFFFILPSLYTVFLASFFSLPLFYSYSLLLSLFCVSHPSIH